MKRKKYLALLFLISGFCIAACGKKDAVVQSSTEKQTESLTEQTEIDTGQEETETEQKENSETQKENLTNKTGTTNKKENSSKKKENNTIKNETSVGKVEIPAGEGNTSGSSVGSTEKEEPSSGSVVKPEMGQDELPMDKVDKLPETNTPSSGGADKKPENSAGKENESEFEVSTEKESESESASVDLPFVPVE